MRPNLLSFLWRTSLYTSQTGVYIHTKDVWIALVISSSYNKDPLSNYPSQLRLVANEDDAIFIINHGYYFLKKVHAWLEWERIKWVKDFLDGKCLFLYRILREQNFSDGNYSLYSIIYIFFPTCMPSSTNRASGVARNKLILAAAGF